MQRIHLIVVPHFCINFILLREKRLEINQYNDRIARNVPAPYADGKVIFCKCMLFPCCTKVIGLDKQRVLFPLPKIRSYEKQSIMKSCLQGICSRGQNRIDTSNLVTYFPA